MRITNIPKAHKVPTHDKCGDIHSQDNGFNRRIFTALNPCSIMPAAVFLMTVGLLISRKTASSGDAFTAQMGPVAMRISGDHIVTRWAREIYQPLETNQAPDLEFALSLDKPGTADAHARLSDLTIGDGVSSVGGDTLAYRMPRYAVQFASEPDRLTVQVRQRKHRPLWLESLADPDEAWKMWSASGASLNIHVLKDFAYLIMPVGLQCRLLRHRATLVHSSTLEMDGRAIIFPAWGGVGKSTIATRCMLHGQARFIADDYTIIDSQGQAYLNLLPIHVYAYHMQQDALLKQRIIDHLPPMNRFSRHVGNALRPKRVRRWVNPTDLFGADRLAKQAKLEQVVLMFRSDRSEFLWEDVAPERIAEACASILLAEIKPLGEASSLANSGWESSFFPSADQLYQQVVEICSQAFSGAKCSRLIVPRKTNGDQLMEFMQSHCRLVNEAMTAGT